jgi:hypothetical protein
MRYSEPQPPTTRRPRPSRGWVLLTRWTAVAILFLLAAASAFAVVEWMSAAAPQARSLTVHLRQVDGGPRYYGRFANPLPTSPHYFPIGVWGAYDQTKANMDLDGAAGINTYVWAANSDAMPDIRADGRFHVIQDEGARANVGSETAGWLLGDEMDMSDNTSTKCPDTLNSIKPELPAHGRMRFANWGKGLALPPGDPSIGDNGNWWAHGTEQNCWTNNVDVDSVDLYWFTDPDPPTGAGSERFGYEYGNNIRNLRHADASDGKMHPHWGFVETAWPFSQTAAEGGRAILPVEMRSAVWHQMIAGARGLIWFQHSFGGPCKKDSHTIQTNCNGTRLMAVAIDEQLKRLAPVLNSPFVTSRWSMSGDVDAAVRWSGGHFYVMAGAKTGATKATFSMPCVGDATATRLAPSNIPSESASIPVSGGSFTDSFADKNAVHIYRIDGGSRCGLTTR